MVSTGPPRQSGRPSVMGAGFPSIPIPDMVRAQARCSTGLVESTLCSVCRGLDGRHSVAAWNRALSEACSPRLPNRVQHASSAQNIAFPRYRPHAVMADSGMACGSIMSIMERHPASWPRGARMPDITYLSDAALHRKFGADARTREASEQFSFSTRFPPGLELSALPRFVLCLAVRCQQLLYPERGPWNDFDSAGDHHGVSGEGVFIQASRPVSACCRHSDWLFPTSDSPRAGARA